MEEPGATGSGRASRQIDVTLIGVGGVDLPLFDPFLGEFIDGIRIPRKSIICPEGLDKCFGKDFCIYAETAVFAPPRLRVEME